MSRLLDGWETKSDHSKSTVTATTSCSRACIHQISWSCVLEKYQSKDYNQSFNQVLYTVRSSKFKFCLAYFKKSCTSLESHSIGRLHITLKVKELPKDGTKHQKPKNMMRIYCFETEKDWDEGIHLLLFAARESVQESLDSVHWSLCLGILWEHLLNCLKRSYCLAVLSLLIFSSMFQTFALSFLELVS